eukprot:g3114.t1
MEKVEAKEDANTDLDALKHIAKRCEKELDKIIAQAIEEKERYVTETGVGMASYSVCSKMTYDKTLTDLTKKCILMLPESLCIPIIFKCGERLFEICEYNAAKCFYAKCDGLSAAAMLSTNSCLPREEALSIEIRSAYRTSLCEYHMVQRQDPTIKYPHSAARIKNSLRAIERASQKILLSEEHGVHERLYWLVYNGTVHTYDISTALAKCGLANLAIPHLTFSALAMESIVNLSTLRYLSWRVELYCAVACCYASLRKWDEAWASASRGMNQVDLLYNLERLQPRLLDTSKSVFQKARQKLAHARDAFCAQFSERVVNEMEEGKTSEGNGGGINDENGSDAQIRRWRALAEALGTLGSCKDRNEILESDTALADESLVSSTIESVPTETALVIMRSLVASVSDNRFEAFARCLQRRWKGKGVTAAASTKSSNETKEIETSSTRSTTAMEFDLLSAIRRVKLDESRRARTTASANDDGNNVVGGKVDSENKKMEESVGKQDVSEADTKALLKKGQAVAAGTRSRDFGDMDIPGRALTELSNTLTRVARTLQTRAPDKIGVRLKSLIRFSIFTLWNPYMKHVLSACTQNASSSLLSPDWIRQLTRAALFSIHVAANVIDMDAPVLRATTSLRLGILLASMSSRDWRSAIQILRSGLEYVRRVREGSVNFFLHVPATEVDANALSLATLTTTIPPNFAKSNRAGGGRHSSGAGVFGLGCETFDRDHAISTLHAEIVNAMLHAEISWGIELADLAAAEVPIATKKKRAHQREKKTSKTNRTLDDTNRSPLNITGGARPDTEETVGTIDRATERRLLAESGSNVYWHVLLAIRRAECTESVTEKRKKLLQAIEYVERAESSAAKTGTEIQARSLKADLEPSRTPRAPLFVGRSSSSVTIRIQDFLPRRVDVERKQAFWIVYGKSEGSGTDVSLNNTELRGCGIRVAPNLRTVTVTDLEPNNSYVFAVASYDESGKIIGGLGRTSKPIATVLPLPTILLWSRICEGARNILSDVVQTAATRIFNHFARTGPRQSLSASNPSCRFSLKRDVLQVSSVPEIRSFIFAVQDLTGQDTSCDHLEQALRDCANSTPRFLRDLQIRLLETLGRLNVALDAAVSIDDGALIMKTVSCSFDTMQTLLKLPNCRKWLLPTLNFCFQAGKFVSADLMTTTFKEIMSCVCFEILRAFDQIGETNARKAIVEMCSAENDRLCEVPEYQSLLDFLLAIPSCRNVLVESHAQFEDIAGADDDKMAIVKTAQERLERLDPTSNEHANLLSFVVHRMLSVDESVKGNGFSSPARTFTWLLEYASKRSLGRDRLNLQIDLVTRIVKEHVRIASQQSLRRAAWMDTIPLANQSNVDDFVRCVLEMDGSRQDFRLCVPREDAVESDLRGGDEDADGVREGDATVSNKEEDVHVEEKNSELRTIDADAYVTQKYASGDVSERARQQLTWLSHLEMLRGLSLYASVIVPNDTRFAMEGPSFDLVAAVKRGALPRSSRCAKSATLDADAASVVAEFKSDTSNEDAGEQITSFEDAMTAFDGNREKAAFYLSARRFENATCDDVLVGALDHLSRAATRARYASAWLQLGLVCKYMWNIALRANLSPCDFSGRFASSHYSKAASALVEMIRLSLAGNGAGDGDVPAMEEEEEEVVVEEGASNIHDRVQGETVVDDVLSVDSRTDHTDDTKETQSVDLVWIGKFVSFAIKAMYVESRFEDAVALGNRFFSVVPQSHAEYVLSITVLCQQRIVDRANAEERHAKDALSTFQREEELKQKGKRKRRRRRGQGLTEEELAVLEETKRLTGIMSDASDFANARRNELDTLQSTQDGIDRDKKAMLQAFESCRERADAYFRVAAIGKDVESKESDGTISAEDVVAAYKETISLLRKKQERGLLVRALNDLGDFSWSVKPSEISPAHQYWRDGFDAIFSKYNAIDNWRSLNVGNDDSTAKNTIETYGFFEVVIGACMLAKVALRGKEKELGERWEHVQCASRLLCSIFDCSLSHPSKFSDFDATCSSTLWPRFDPFDDPNRLSPSSLLHSIHYLAQEMLRNKGGLEALALSTMMEQTAHRTCENLRATLEARTLRLRSMIEVGHFRDGFAVLEKLLLGNDLPESFRSLRSSCTSSASSLGSMTSFVDYEEPNSSTNAPALDSFLEICKSAPLFSNEILRRQVGESCILLVRLCCVKFLVRLAALCVSSERQETLLNAAISMGNEIVTRVTTPMTTIEKQTERPATALSSKPAEDPEESAKNVGDDGNDDDKEEKATKIDAAKPPPEAAKDIEANRVANPRSTRDLNILCEALLQLAAVYEIKGDYDVAQLLVSGAMRWLSSVGAIDDARDEGTWECVVPLGAPFWLRCRYLKTRYLMHQGRFVAASSECRTGLNEARLSNEAVWSRRLLKQQARLLALEGRIDDAVVLLDERIVTDRQTSSNDLLSAKLRTSYADALVDLSNSSDDETQALRMRLEAIDLYVEAQECLESALRRSRWQGFRKSSPCVRSNIFADGVDLLAYVKLKLATIVSNLGDGDEASQRAARALVCESLQTLEHTWKPLRRIRSQLLFLLGQIYRRLPSLPSSSDADAEEKRTEDDVATADKTGEQSETKRQFLIRSKMLNKRSSVNWTCSFSVEIDSDDEKWLSKWCDNDEDWRRRAVACFLSSARLSINGGGHRRDLLRAAFLELVNILGREALPEIRHRAAFYLSCAARTAAMIESLQKNVSNVVESTSLDVDAIRTIPVVVVQRALRAQWCGKSVETCDASVLKSPAFCRSLLYSVTALQREAETLGCGEDSLCDDLHETLRSVYEPYASICCFKGFPDFDRERESDAFGTKDRVCVQWYCTSGLNSVSSSTREETIGMFALLGPFDDDEGGDKTSPELVHVGLRADRVRMCGRLVNERLCLKRAPNTIALFQRAKVDSGNGDDDILKALKVSLRPAAQDSEDGVGTCAVPYGLDDERSLRSLSAALDFSSGINTTNRALCMLFRGTL